MIVAFINAHQTNWDKHLPIIQYNYNTTVNDATGHDPYFLMFGRSANVQGELAEEENGALNVNEYAKNFAEVMDWIWKYNSERVVNNSKEMKNKQHPRTFLEFKEYNEGDYFYSRRIPKRFSKDEEERMLHKIKAKLQNRWTGPYRIVKKISPVLYEADVHNGVKRVHAVNMRPY